MSKATHIYDLNLQFRSMSALYEFKEKCKACSFLQIIKIKRSLQRWSQIAKENTI